MDRRQTLHPLMDTAGNTKSNIPIPATVVKNIPTMRQPPLPASRMSMLPSQQNALQPRQSIMRVGLQNIDPMLASVRKPVDMAFGRTPMSAKQYVCEVLALGAFYLSSLW